MNSREADALAEAMVSNLAAGDEEEAYLTLKPVLDQRTPFRFLDRIGDTAGTGRWPETSALLHRLAQDGAEGGWVIIGAVLRRQYPRHPTTVFHECRRCIVIADSWYGSDILGERVPGPALVEDFEQALTLLMPWREETNRWLRRGAGVAVHYWAKRSQGEQALAGQAQSLLALLEPLFSEWEMDAVKGVGWGLKTLGKHYPRQLADWLVAQRGRLHRRLMLRKAVTYLPDDQRQQLLEAFGL